MIKSLLTLLSLALASEDTAPDSELVFSDFTLYLRPDYVIANKDNSVDWW